MHFTVPFVTSAILLSVASAAPLDIAARVVCGGFNQIPCPDQPLPGAAFGAVSKLAARESLDARFACGGKDQIPCPATPIGGPVRLPTQPVPQVEDNEKRIVPGPCKPPALCIVEGPISPQPSAPSVIRPVPQRRRIPCGGGNLRPCPSTPIGGPIRLPRPTGTIIADPPAASPSIFVDPIIKDSEKRFVCGGPNGIPCPAQPVGGHVRPLAERFACGGPNGIPCPAKPIGGPVLAERFACGGPNGIPCPAKPIGGPVSLPLAERFACGGPNEIPCPAKPIGGPLRLDTRMD